MAPLITLILALLCKGMLSQQMTDYTLMVPASVSVQQGLCVHIPCRFTYDQRDKTSNGQLRWYWFQKASYVSGYWVRDSLVATNDKERTVEQSAQNRFQLTGNVAQGDCSFDINDAQVSDQRPYFFRIEGGRNLRYSYLSNVYRTHPLLEVVVTALTEKPIILNSSQVVSGKAATFTCWAPGACSGTKPTIFWMLGTGGWTPGSPLSKPFSNGSRIHGSNFTFTPSVDDQGKLLTCHVSYPAVASQTENRILLDMAYPPLAVKITGTVTRPGRPGSSPEKGKENVDLLEAQEGDTISLHCQAEGRPAPSLSWTKGNQTLNNSDTGALLLSQVRPEDAGMYQCQAENPHGSAYDTFLVNVQYIPRIMQLRASHIFSRDPALTQELPTAVANGSQLVVQEGGSLRLFCKAHSYPLANICWVKGGRSSEPLGQDDSLELTNLTVEDGGEYMCQAQNSVGSAQGIFSLSVAYAPRLSGNPQTTTTCHREDSGLLCTCSLHSWPPPHIQWQVAEQIVTGNTTRGDLHATSLVQGMEVTSSLRWKGNVDWNQAILCLGNNSVGVYRAQFLLCSLETEISISPLVAGLCGILVAAVVFSLVLLLVKLYQQRTTSSKAGGLEAVEAMNGGHQRRIQPSLIYSNILPVGRRIPQAAQANMARERNPKAGPVSKEHTPSTDESEEVHYASLEFKQKDRGAPVPEQESVEYSVIRPK